MNDWARNSRTKQAIIEAFQRCFLVPGKPDLRRDPIKNAILYYEKFLNENPPEDVTHLPAEVQDAFFLCKIARDEKASTASNARVCPHCSKVYANATNLKLHIEGNKKKKSSCPYSLAFLFLPRLQHPTDKRLCRTAPPEDPADPFKGRKCQIYTTRFDPRGKWEHATFVKTNRSPRNPNAPPTLTIKFPRRRGQRAKFTGKWQSLTSVALKMVY